MILQKAFWIKTSMFTQDPLEPFSLCSKSKQKYTFKKNKEVVKKIKLREPKENKTPHPSKERKHKVDLKPKLYYWKKSF